MLRGLEIVTQQKIFISYENKRRRSFEKNVSETGCVTKLDIVKEKSKLKLVEKSNLNWQKTKKT